MAGVLRRLPIPRSIALAVVLVLVAMACNTDGGRTPPVSQPPRATSEVIEAPEMPPKDADTSSPSMALAEASPVGFEVQPSVNQLHVLGAAPATDLVLRSADDQVWHGTVDEQGSFLWRDIPAGEYTVEVPDAAPPQSSGIVRVTDPDDLPEPSFYETQRLDEGFGYLTTRDGTTLSALVSFPAGDGPFPTVVQYSGYGPSNPAGDGRSTPTEVFTALGYAHVGVNMRGTGCSGGSFEFFEPVQSTDGYDMIEVIAAQPWVMHNRVGMVGVSYPGIAQLFVAQMQPPSLAAITPLSVLDDSTGFTLYPGGILNTGFALDWSDEREREARPYGQGWEQALVDAGDTTCAENQRLRLQNTDLRSLIEDNPFHVPELADPVAPATFVDRIDVPVFLAGAWQDEQTGGHFPTMLDRFESAPHLFATMVNGTHVESLASTDILQRFVEFLELYVARRPPELSTAAAMAPVLAGQVTGVEGLTLPDPERYAGMTYDQALAAYESQPPIRILFEEGAAPDMPAGAPVPRFAHEFSSWPPPGVATAWYLGLEGRLVAEPVASALPDDQATAMYTADPSLLPSTFHDPSTGSIWAATPEYQWEPMPEGSGVGWVSDPLAADLAVVGSASLDLWLRSSAPDTDLEVTISEVRADGNEVYVQSGWLRASHRALDEDASTPARPVHTHREADAAPLPAGEFIPLRVEIFPFAHVFRAGTRLRVTVDAPGNARPLWAFDTTISAGEVNEIAGDADRPSRLVLNVVDGIDAPPDPPACGSLRGQPCRLYVPVAGG